MICPRHELLLKRPVDFVGTNEAAAKKGILTSSGRGGDGGMGGGRGGWRGWHWYGAITQFDQSMTSSLGLLANIDLVRYFSHWCHLYKPTALLEHISIIIQLLALQVG